MVGRGKGRGARGKVEMGDRWIGRMGKKGVLGGGAGRGIRT